MCLRRDVWYTGLKNSFSVYVGLLACVPSVSWVDSVEGIMAWCRLACPTTLSWGMRKYNMKRFHRTSVKQLMIYIIYDSSIWNQANLANIKGPLGPELTAAELWCLHSTGALHTAGLKPLAWPPRTDNQEEMTITLIQFCRRSAVYNCCQDNRQRENY